MDFDWLVGWFYGISTFVGYLTTNSFLYKKKEYIYRMEKCKSIKWK